MIRRQFCALLGLLLSATTLCAAEPIPIGTRVMPRLQCDFRVDDKVVADGDAVHWPATVQRVNGRWLWLGEGSPGWVFDGQIVTLDQAVAYYGSAIRLEPSAWAYRCRGLARVAKEDVAGAELDLAQALKLAPQDSRVHYGLGLTSVARSRYAQADTEFSKAIEIDPDYAQAYKARGYLWSLQKDEDKVIRDYDEAIRIVPTDAYSYLNRGLAWLRKEELDKALADLDRSLQLQPESALALKFRGYLRNTRGERDRAIEDFDRSITLDARDGETYLMRGQAQQALRKYAEALADFSRAIKLDPNNPRTHNSRAWLQATCPDATVRNGKNAVVDGRRACLLIEEKDAYCCGTLGAAYAEAGDFQSAIEWQTKGMKLKAGDEKYLEAARKRLELYKAGQPYHLESQT